MAKIVGAFAQGHILLDDDGVEAQAETILNGFKDIGKKIRELQPDLMVIISDDHMLNIGAAQQAPLAIAVADQHRPMGDMEVPTDRLYRGHREFAQGFLNHAATEGFDLVKLEAEGYRPDHGIMLPVIFTTPSGKIPFVPILVNVNMTPTPSPKRCWDLGTSLKRYIEQVRPVEERIVVVGTGGLSHWLQIEGDGEINEGWDKKILRQFADGHAHEIAALSNDEILTDGGNGGTEIKNWLVMAATVPNAKGRILFYEPMYSWKTGMGAVEMAL